MGKIKTIRESLELRPSLKGKRFGDLDEKEKKILYTSELHDDHVDVNVIADTVLFAHPGFIDTQLRIAFMYKNKSIIS